MDEYTFATVVLTDSLFSIKVFIIPLNYTTELFSRVSCELDLDA